MMQRSGMASGWSHGGDGDSGTPTADPSVFPCPPGSSLHLFTEILVTKWWMVEPGTYPHLTKSCKEKQPAANSKTLRLLAGSAERTNAPVFPVSTCLASVSTCLADEHKKGRCTPRWALISAIFVVARGSPGGDLRMLCGDNRRNPTPAHPGVRQ